MHTETHPFSAANDLSEDALDRAERYLWIGDLSALTDLPLRPHEMMEAAEVLLGAPPSHPPTTTDQPAPTLSSMLRHRLRVLADETDAQADAALLILAADYRARTGNTLLPHRRPARYLTHLRAV